MNQNTDLSEDDLSQEQENQLYDSLWKRGVGNFESVLDFFREPASETPKRLREYTEPL